MAVLKDVKEKLALTLLTEEYDEKRKVADATVCDLLSWVMAHGCADMAWITVQTHMNVLAVASLHDFACVIIPEGIKVPGETIDKANEKKLRFFHPQRRPIKSAGDSPPLESGTGNAHLLRLSYSFGAVTLCKRRYDGKQYHQYVPPEGVGRHIGLRP